MHRDLLDHGDVSPRVTGQEIVAPHVPGITDRSGGAVAMLPAVASVHHGDRARLLGAVVERNESGEHFVRRAGGPEMLVEMPGDNVRLLLGVNVFVVALDFSVGGGPVGRPVRPRRKFPTALTSVVALARLGRGVHFGVGEQLLGQIPATLRIKPDIFLGGERFDFLGGKS
ncbi:hypothetical protein ACH40F_31975 [Streptomyces sp. NPDC020794]|uniref:hypothetical protein n=1 Tax=unclassified Streptomyces TaxID=2593676 RepID=UPI0036E7221B